MALEPAVQRIVTLLKYDHQHPRLNDKIRRVLGKDHTPALQFKIKQEIVRLAKPCRRVLDFRSKMTGVDVDQFEFQDMRHYLDQQSAQELKKEFEKYNRVYSEGVYEHVSQFFVQNKQALIDAQAGLKANIQFTQFANTVRRQEERMNLASPISIARLQEPDKAITKDFVPSEDNLQNAVLAVTSDISQTGLGIRTKQHLKEGDRLAISFDGLAKELLFKQKYVLYQVVKVLVDEDGFRVALKLQGIDSNKEFADYAKNLIYSHKHKYKVNIDNILESIQSKGHEQYYVACNPAIHLYFDRKEKLRYCLTNPDFSELYKFFRHDGNHSVIPSLFEQESVLLALRKEKQLFYLISRKDSDETGLQFCGQVADGSDVAKAMFKSIVETSNGWVLKLTITQCQPAVALQNTSVPEDALHQYGSLRIHRYSPQVQKIAQQLGWIISLVPVPFSSAAAYICSDVTDIPELNYSTLPATQLTEVQVETLDKRHEDRFELNTTVMFRYDGKDYRTKTRNVSASGLAIEVGDKLYVPIGEELTVRFEEFVSRTDNYNLDKCKYKVIYCEDGLLGVSNRDDSTSDARSFWEKLILAKIDSFTLAGREHEPYGLNRALRNLASANVTKAVAFFNIKQNKPNILTIALPTNKNKHPLWADAPKRTQHVFKTWFYAPGVVRPLMALCESFINSNLPQHAIAMVAHKKLAHRVEVIHSKLIDASSAQVGQLASLVKVYKKRDCDITLFSVTMQRTREEYRRYYTDELNYLNRFAAHKCEKLYADVSAVTAMMNFIDISELMLETLLKPSS